MTPVFLLEDHDEALRAWRRLGLRGQDLIHIDAHMDCAYQPARPINEVFAQAKSVQDLKRQLEYSLSFLHYESKLSRQTDIGNYIYPAMAEGIVRDLYWVVPGDLAEFQRSLPALKRQLTGLARAEDRKTELVFTYPAAGSLAARIFGRTFQISTLDALPTFKTKVLLDIDTDFLVIDSVRHANNTDQIGQRRPWLSPAQLCGKLSGKIQAPAVTTIAYSTNGGWTPMRHRHLADEIKFHLAPARFRARLQRSQRAALLFADFEATGRRASYTQAARLIPQYRMPDNNPGPLFLKKGRMRRAEIEFRKILRVDPNNPGAILGLADVFTRKGRHAVAFDLLGRGAREAHRKRIFAPLRPGLRLAMARMKAGLEDYAGAEKLLRAYLRQARLDGQTQALLGRICERQSKYAEATAAYQDALRMGYEAPAVLLALAKTSRQSKIDIIDFVRLKARIFLRNMARTCAGRHLKNNRQAAIKRYRRFEQALSRLGLSIKGAR